MSPKGIQRSRRKGDRLPAGTICVDRTTRWGNPYRVTRDPEGGWMVASPLGVTARFLVTKIKANQVAVMAFENLLNHPIEGIAYPPRTEIRAALRGHDLGCWCPVTMSCPEASRNDGWGAKCIKGWHYAPGAPERCQVCGGSGVVPYPCHRWSLIEVANA